MPNPAIDRLTGKFGFVHVVDATGSKVVVPFTAWIATTTTLFADRTATSNYSPTAGMLFRSSVPVVQSLSATVKGRYRRSVTPSTIIAKLFKSWEPMRVELGFNPLDPYVDMYCWIENFETGSQIEETVNFECTLRSEGEIKDSTNSGNLPDKDPGDDGGDQ